MRVRVAAYLFPPVWYILLFVPLSVKGGVPHICTFRTETMGIAIMSCGISTPCTSLFHCNCRRQSSSQRPLDRQETCSAKNLGAILLSAVLFVSYRILSGRNRPTRKCSQTVWSTGIPLLTTRFHMLACTVSPADPRRQSFRSRGSSDMQNSFSLPRQVTKIRKCPCSVQHLLCLPLPAYKSRDIRLLGRIMRAVTPRQLAHNQLGFVLSLQKACILFSGTPEKHLSLF